jgi:hypothetical protein
MKLRLFLAVLAGLAIASWRLHDVPEDVIEASATAAKAALPRREAGAANRPAVDAIHIRSVVRAVAAPGTTSPPTIREVQLTPVSVVPILIFLELPLADDSGWANLKPQELKAYATTVAESVADAVPQQGLGYGDKPSWVLVRILERIRVPRNDPLGEFYRAEEDSWCKVAADDRWQWDCLAVAVTGTAQLPSVHA